MAPSLRPRRRPNPQTSDPEGTLISGPHIKYHPESVDIGSGSAATFPVHRHELHDNVEFRGE